MNNQLYKGIILFNEREKNLDLITRKDGLNDERF